VKWQLPLKTWLALFAFACLLAPAAPAQVDATRWQSGLVKLLAGWHEHAGDNPAWAQPGFDDSQWRTVDLDDLGAAQPGWRWYRLQVKLAPQRGHLHLLIAGGQGTYEIYLNGVEAAGAVIRPFDVSRPTEQIFPLPDDVTHLTIALRTSTPRVYTSWHLPLFLTAAVGSPESIDNERQAMESGRLYAALPSIAINLVLIIAGLGSFALFRSQLRSREYLWLGLYLLLLGISNLLLALVQTGLAALPCNNLLADPLVFFFTIAQIEFTFSFAGRRPNRAWRAYEAILLSPLLLNALTWIGILASGTYLVVEALVILPAAVLLPVALLLWYRHGNREAGWLVLPSLLPLAMSSIYDLGTVSIYLGWGFADFLDNPIMIGSIPLQIADLGAVLFLLAIGVVMFFRFTRVSREQARVAVELAAAREIQRTLVPNTLPEIDGYRIEAAWFPADEVGGDFYQVMTIGDGKTLVLVGDVSGKGLKAAMTGTLALGALRALAGQRLGPAALLTQLNRQLAETVHEGFVTCLCTQITAQGELIIANAGHLPPYRNGAEMPIESSLPLALVADVQYEEVISHLDPGDRFTLLSDGVAEARNSKGDLFGFERTRAISTEPANAIAEAALRYGQADDITVLTLLRLPAKSLTAEQQKAAAGFSR
jgi:sigma-B regulation protein RsbU (phosphoserine phosphatase)